MDDDELRRRMRVNLMPAKYNNLEIKRFEITDEVSSWLNKDVAIAALDYGVDRATKPGSYTKLVEWVDEDGKRKERIWMSDTDAEVEDHLPIMRRASEKHVRRVLVNGLGLGVVLTGLRTFDHLERIDVVESNEDVIALIGAQHPDSRVCIYEQDAYKMRWGKEDKWDAVWHDIWPEICSENLIGMWRLVQKYMYRTIWQGAWVLDLCARQWDETEALFHLVEAKDGAKITLGHPLYETYKAHRAEGRAGKKLADALYAKDAASTAYR